jgi:hypothetical protein
MMDHFNATMVDTAAQHGCRTLCQYPGCLQPIREEMVFGGSRMWFHIGGGDGAHEPTPVAPEPESEPQSLSRDAFDSPKALATALSRAAKASGYEVDDTPKGLEALERVCAVALPVLIPESGGEAA